MATPISYKCCGDTREGMGGTADEMGDGSLLELHENFRSENESEQRREFLRRTAELIGRRESTAALEYRLTEKEPIDRGPGCETHPGPLSDEKPF